VRAGLPLLLLLLACGAEAVRPEDCPALAPRLPASLEDAAAARAAGARWTDREARAAYVCAVAEIPAKDELRAAAGADLESRARAASAARHDARLISRAMMQDPKAVKALQARDIEKYGNPDGPTFDWLVARARSEGLEGDAVWRSIIDSAARTDAATNRWFGLGSR
jgi:hypothetical protein